MDLSTTYIGLKLRTPLVPSACGPLTNTISKIRALEDAGAAAIVVHSLFEEEILHEAHELDHYLTYGSYSYAEALNYFPEANEYELGPDEYLEHLHKAKQVVQIPVIGSLNGVSTGGWIKYAKLIEETGVDALELNIYYIPTDPDLPGVEVEQMYVNVLADVRRTIKIPVAIKLSPFFSNMASMAKRLSYAGANGLVLFNRFYQPDIDLEQLEVVPNVILSTPQALRLPLRWIAILYGKVNSITEHSTESSTEYATGRNCAQSATTVFAPKWGLAGPAGRSPSFDDRMRRGFGSECTMAMKIYRTIALAKRAASHNY